MALGVSETLTGQTKVTFAESLEHEGLLFAKRVTEIPSSMIKRFDYVARADDNPVYIGFAPRGLAEGISGWLIYKFTYEESPVTRVTAIDTSFGNWTARATYF